MGERDTQAQPCLSEETRSTMEEVYDMIKALSEFLHRDIYGIDLEPSDITVSYEVYVKIITALNEAEEEC